MPQFPSTRLRRLRQTDYFRRLVGEIQLSVNDLIWPVFVLPDGRAEPKVSSMPRVFGSTIEQLVPRVQEAKDLGIPAIAIFPVTDRARKTW